MSEQTIAEGTQSILQGMDDFASADVVINDWTILDGPTKNAPYVIIETSDDFVSRQDVPAQGETWQIPHHLVTRFTDFKTALDSFRDTRQNIIDEFNTTGTNRSAGITTKMTDVREIRGGGPIEYLYEKHLTDEEQREADPTYVVQPLIFEVYEEAN
jgi:hypothetical protein